MHSTAETFLRRRILRGFLASTAARRYPREAKLLQLVAPSLPVVLHEALGQLETSREYRLGA